MYLGFNIQLGFKAKGNFSSFSNRRLIFTLTRARALTHIDIKKNGRVEEAEKETLICFLEEEVYE